MQISSILDYIDNGHMALPEFQRGYVWGREQVRKLFQSLYRGHPVGSLLVWATDASTAAHRGDSQLAPGVVKLLLDGQQRITSLYGVIRSNDWQNPETVWRQGNRSANRRRSHHHNGNKGHQPGPRDRGEPLQSGRQAARQHGAE